MSDLETKMRRSLELLDAAKTAAFDCTRAINDAIDKAQKARDAAFVALEATGLGVRAINETLPKLPKKVGEPLPIDDEHYGAGANLPAALEREAAE